ncbi:small serum protein 5-like [Anolis carolinensis]|uniref:small serum protein 5-like n=1 Tax=Anolis carolinensis TaxID=28377 RepID=UPI002F2B36A9
MKFLLSLAAICMTLGLCWGFCAYIPSKGKQVDGRWVPSDECLDMYDGVSHPIGSTWNSSHCMRCSCLDIGMRCCSRYGPSYREGCKAIMDWEACEYKFYKLEDISQPCSP